MLASQMRGCPFWMCFLVLFVSAGAAQSAVVLPNGARVEKVDFERHVMGLLGRSGCSAGACHGSFQGKGGLYLSLFGYSAEKDHQSFTREGLGRRINRENPDASLILLKATGQVPHGGGVRFNKESYPYQILREWIAEGAARQPGTGEVKQVRVVPSEHQFRGADEKVQLRVFADYADGTTQDVSAFSEFRVNDDYVAEINPDGVVRSIHPGDTTTVVIYRGNVRTARVLVPSPSTPGSEYPSLPVNNYIDREVYAKLRKLNIVPSDQSSDTEFLRRVTIDAIGTLPTPDEVRAFLADTDPAKRSRKIEQLLAHPMHAALWATKFCDFTANSVDTMENPPVARPKRSKMWHDWFRKRLAQNMPYDQIVHGILCATSRDGGEAVAWVHKAAEQEKTALETFKNDYADRSTLDLFWRRGNNTAGFPLEQMAELTAAAFLGVRVECAQCHKHPFDRWTQTDYRAYANIFSQVKFGNSSQTRAAIAKANQDIRSALQGKNNNQIPQVREVYVDNDQLRRLPHPETNATLKPKALGGPEIELKGDAREALFQWLTQADNPYFARIFVNRVWAHYFGVGLVDPVDNFSAANPPSNEKLLDALARDFIASGFDIRHIERTILLSRVYQHSAIPNESNRFDKTNFARSYVRRMMAEVMVDVLNQALGTTENYGVDAPAGVRAIEVAPSRVQSQALAYAFRIFGRPARSTTCDCERSGEPALPQTLYLMTDKATLDKITGGRLKKLMAEKRTEEEVFEELCLATLSRPPSENELAVMKKAVERRGKNGAYVDALWALVNSREFVLNH